MSTKKTIHHFDHRGNALLNYDHLLAENEKLRKRVETLERRLQMLRLVNSAPEERASATIH